jgi:hypothetical protein
VACFEVGSFSGDLCRIFGSAVVSEKDFQTFNGTLTMCLGEAGEWECQTATGTVVAVTLTFGR